MSLEISLARRRRWGSFRRCASRAQPVGMAALLALGAGIGIARAEPLSLAQAQQLALARNADLRVATAGVAAAAAQVRQAREFPNPTLGLSTAGIPTDGRGGGSALHNEFLQRSYDSILSLNQLFETGGKRTLRQESTRAGQRSAEAQRDDARRLLLAGVTQAYLATLVSREDVRVLRESATSLEREAELAAVRLATGDISATDKDQIDIAAERFALDADAAAQAARAATITLETLLGFPEPSGSIELSDTLETLATRAAPVAVERAPLDRPDIAAAAANVAKAEADWRLQRRERIPDITLSAQFEHHPPDLPNSAGIGFSLPLPVWNRNNGAVAAALAAREQADAQLEKVRLQAAAEVATARSWLREAENRAAVFHERLVPKSVMVLRAVKFAYEKGGASLLDLLSAQRSDNDVRQAAAHAAAESAAARVALAAALNRLGSPVTSDSRSP